MQNGECFTMQTLGTFFAATVIIRKINDLHSVMTQRYTANVLSVKIADVRLRFQSKDIF